MFELWKLKRERDRIEKSYQKHLAELKKKKVSPDEFEQLRWQESNDVGDAYQQIHIFMSQQLLQEGYKVRRSNTRHKRYRILGSQ